MTSDATGTSPAHALDALSGVIDWTDVGGVPALYAPAPGPRTAALLFRVGTVDETLATNGLTHLVEHLALFDQNLSDLHHNGSTNETYTLFHVAGDDEEVVRFMSGVCAALRNLPVHRLETEKTILRTEGSNRGSGGARALRLWRYGPRGLGLSGYDELGLPRLGADDVHRWARTYFTRENACFFFTGDALPSGLTLDLPHGARMPVPESVSILPQTPAHFPCRSSTITLDGDVERSSASMLMAKVADRALFRELRQEGGLSYRAGADYSPWSATRATVRLYADALPDHQDAAVGAFVDACASLRLGSIDESELELVRESSLKDLEVPDLGARLLGSTALGLLWGASITTPAQLREELGAVSVSDIADAAAGLWSDGLLEAPARDLAWAGVSLAPAWSADAVPGTRFPRAGDEDVTLVVGDEGVTLETPGGYVTVRFDECVLMSTRPDGARLLTGSDGFAVPIEPTLHPTLSSDDVARLVDARVDPTIVAHLPAREPDDIPRPSSPESAAGGWTRIRSALRRRR